MSTKESLPKLKFILLQIAFIICLIMTGVSLPALAQGNGAYAEGESGRSAGKREMDQPVKDAWIQGKLEGVYLFNEHLSPFSINTEVNDGVVSLTGNVESEIDKNLAEEIAKGIDGVKKVNNELVVEAGSVKDQGKITADRGRDADRNGMRDREAKNENNFVRWVDDATVTAIVKSKLLANDNISGMNIDVDTHNNRVILSGEVESDEVRQLAEEIARNTEDVADVENNLRVADRVADIE